MSLATRRSEVIRGTRSRIAATWPANRSPARLRPAGPSRDDELYREQVERRVDAAIRLSNALYGHRGVVFDASSHWDVIERGRVGTLTHERTERRRDLLDHAQTHVAVGLRRQIDGQM